MGKLLFVNTNRINGIFGVVICAAIAACGIGLTMGGNYAGALLIPFGIAGVAFCLKIATQRAEIYEHGFVSKSIYGSVSGSYSDLKSIYRMAVRRNGVLTTNIFLTTNAGQKLGISNEKFLKGDDKMELLLDRSSGDLAETWAKTLDKGTEVVWLKDGDSPLLKIRKDGVLVEPKNGLPTFIPLGQFQIKNATFPGSVEILNHDQKVMNINSVAPNYFVGLKLIELLLGKQQQSKAATNRG